MGILGAGVIMSDGHEIPEDFPKKNPGGEYCLLCGEILGPAKFIKKFKERFYHVNCEINIFDQAVLNLYTKTVYFYGIRAQDPARPRILPGSCRISQGSRGEP